MSSSKKHPYHLVDPSPWPLISSLSIFVLAVGAVLLMHHIDWWVFAIGIILLIACALGWWLDVIKESNQPGVHTPPVQQGLKIGMALFIASEVMLFVAFFWGYFHSSLNLAGHIAFQWPPKGIIPFDPMQLPYLNTLILLLSGTAITWAHHEMLKGNFSKVTQALIITVGLGLIFSMVQIVEYAHAAFGLKDGIYPSNFFMATGFHGAHVFIGTIFLCVCLLRNMRREFQPNHHVGFEAAAWYWHFVDVVWLFLFVTIYWNSYSK
ncbi:MAG: cytochrome c oxidase subunit 3 [Pseudomonadota bacterium]|jgi:cytochrome c oxidase subunit 3|nr:cytochrome c oxidase subunit 3 [Alphaproteobacteria bacterium]